MNGNLDDGVGGHVDTFAGPRANQPLVVGASTGVGVGVGAGVAKGGKLHLGIWTLTTELQVWLFRWRIFPNTLDKLESAGLR